MIRTVLFLQNVSSLQAGVTKFDSSMTGLGNGATEEIVTVQM